MVIKIEIYVIFALLKPFADLKSQGYTILVKALNNENVWFYFYL